MIPAERLGHLDQVAFATDRPAIDARALGGIEIRIHPRRGLDVGAAWFRGVPLAWISPAGEGGADSDQWRAAWGGGLVTTCGLDNVGAASEGIGLHGSYTFLRARDVTTERKPAGVVVRGTVDDPRGVRVSRTIRSDAGAGRVEVVDLATNVAHDALEAPLLYHVNLGWPLWDAGASVETDAAEVRPRDADAAPHDWSAAPPEPTPLPERVWEHVGATRAIVTNRDLGLRVTIESSLERLWQWVDPAPGVYALGIEPANCSVLGRAHDRAEGRLPFLEPGAERTTRIAITAEEV
ncbi:MAG: DUF4432 family protein, partial [Actinomycetota bacterium]|nr:DUF4432 family protein [Actinomycetota bacterium]